MTITEFADKFGACLEGREWALANCASMDEVWAKAKPEWMLWIATQPGVLTDRELRLFAVWSARQVQHLMTDPRSVAALDVVERHANGEATDEELAAARALAWSAARAASAASAWSAESALASAARASAWSAGSAARASAWSAARSAAWSAWSASAWSAAWSAWTASAWSAASSAQANWLRDNTSPRW